MRNVFELLAIVHREYLYRQEVFVFIHNENEIWTVSVSTEEEEITLP
jgi:hypothetical protein